MKVLERSNCRTPGQARLLLSLIERVDPEVSSSTGQMSSIPLSAPHQVPSTDFDKTLARGQGRFNFLELRSQPGPMGGIGRSAATQPDHLQTGRLSCPIGKFCILGPDDSTQCSRPSPHQVQCRSCDRNDESRRAPFSIQAHDNVT